MVPEQDEFLMATIGKFNGGPDTRISETPGIGLLKIPSSATAAGTGRCHFHELEVGTMWFDRARVKAL